MREGIQLIWLEDFGRAVGNHLSRICPNVTMIPAVGLFEEFGQIVVLAAPRPADDLCELISRRIYREDKAFVPVIVTGTQITLGPVIQFGRGTCWNCWRRRLLQHSRNPEYLQAISEYYTDQSTCGGPLGYLEAIATLVAAHLCQVIDLLNEGKEVAGTFWRLDCLSWRTTQGSVVGVHDCPVCGLRRNSETRTYQEMQDKLSHLWNREM